MRTRGGSYNLSDSFLCGLAGLCIREYLTGFRKRNLAKKEARAARAKQRQKQEQLELRREVGFFLNLVPKDSPIQSQIFADRDEPSCLSHLSRNGKNSRNVLLKITLLSSVHSMSQIYLVRIVLSSRVSWSSFGRVLTALPNPSFPLG